MSESAAAPVQALHDLEEWDDFLEGRYKEGSSEEEFRLYDATAQPGVAEFYRLNHENQTVDYVLGKEKEYFGLNKGKKTIWEAAEFLNTLVDDSDPDTDLTQIEHLLQTSEAIRRDGHPRWMVLTGFHARPGQVPVPVWRAAVGRGGRYVSGGVRVVEGHRVPGVLRQEPGPQRARVSDEVRHLRAELRAGERAHVIRARRLHRRSDEALHAGRSRSTCCASTRSTRGTATARIEHLCNDKDRAMLEWVLSSISTTSTRRGTTKPNVKELKPYYDDLFAEFLPAKMAW